MYLSNQLSEYVFLDNGTEYNYYSAVYLCKESDTGPIEQAGLILTRYKHPSFSQVITPAYVEFWIKQMLLMGYAV